MGSATKQAERGSVFPIGDAVRLDKLAVQQPFLLAAAFDNCPENLAIVENGCLLYTNRAFAQTFGYPHGSAVQGAPLAQLIPASQLLASPSWDESNSSSLSCDPVFVAIREDGTRLTVQMSSACFHAEQRDMLVLRLRECPPQEPNPSSTQMESLGHLVGAVAHDFNNLLTGILLYCDLLAAGLDSHNPLRSYVSEIRRAGGHSAELVQQLMAVARPHTEPSAQSWNDVIPGMRNLLNRLLGETIELEINLGSDRNHEGCVAIDAVPMRQIILNLLLNARDAMPDGGRISVTSQHCEECTPERGSGPSACVVLTVADTGCGMDAAIRSRLFQTLVTTKSPGNGTGLGLSTVGRIVKEHGGTVQVESELHRGTQVRVHLPCARRQAVDELKSEEQKSTRGNA
jgi:signal transduction histidine kinase